VNSFALEKKGVTMRQLVYNHWGLALGTFLVCISLPSQVSAAQCSSRIPDPKQYLIETGAKLGDKAIPQVLKLIDPSTKLPYSDLLQTLAAAEQMAQCIREQKYKESLIILSGSAGRWIGDELLKIAGFSWIGIAVAPIKYALYKFLNVVASDALEFNIKSYIQARQTCQDEQIINGTCDLAYLEGGWIYLTGRPREGWSPTQAVPGYKPEEVYDFARAIYNAQSKLPALEKDKQLVFNNLQEQIGGNKQPVAVMVSASLKLFSSGRGIVQGQSLISGQTVNGEFQVKNSGNSPVTLDVVTIGGREGQIVVDFPWQRSIALAGNSSFTYKGNLTLKNPGNYHFFTAYRTKDGQWNTAVPTRQGLTNTLDLTVTERLQTTAGTPESRQGIPPTEALKGTAFQEFKDVRVEVESLRLGDYKAFVYLRFYNKTGQDLAIISPYNNLGGSSLVDDTGIRHGWSGVSGMRITNNPFQAHLSEWLILPAGQSGRAAITFGSPAASKKTSKFSLALEFLVIPKDRLLQVLESGKPSNIAPTTLSVVMHDIKPE